MGNWGCTEQTNLFLNFVILSSFGIVIANLIIDFYGLGGLWTCYELWMSY